MISGGASFEEVLEELPDLPVPTLPQWIKEWVSTREIVILQFNGCTKPPYQKLGEEGRKAGMKKKANLDSIDPYLMIGIEGMLLCEYSEEQILSHFRQILKKDYPQKGRKALLADLREASRIREATPPEEWPALLLDILRASGWFPAAVREILNQIEKLPANASKVEVARIVSAARNKMKARKARQR